MSPRSGDGRAWRTRRRHRSGAGREAWTTGPHSADCSCGRRATITRAGRAGFVARAAMGFEAARSQANSIRPVVHIGYHKTATKWFQKQFYPRVENAELVPRETVREAFLEPTALHFDPDRARAMLNGAGPGPILCEEGLSGYLHNGGLAGCLSKDVAYRIRGVFPEARIVIFIKSQPAVVAGSYEQYVRGGGHSRRGATCSRKPICAALGGRSPRRRASPSIISSTARLSSIIGGCSDGKTSTSSPTKPSATIPPRSSNPIAACWASTSISTRCRCGQ
ncbi:MAG: hypothetical protein QOJ27_795 [Sphingomonadales bacterium]|nr:hypothetical protein [Sphingomonadales bacterium]